MSGTADKTRPGSPSHRSAHRGKQARRTPQVGATPGDAEVLQLGDPSGLPASVSWVLAQRGMRLRPLPEQGAGRTGGNATASSPLAAQPALVLLLPDKSGATVRRFTAWQRAQPHCRAPVIALLSAADAGEAERLYALGADEVLPAEAPAAQWCRVLDRTLGMAAMAERLERTIERGRTIERIARIGSWYWIPRHAGLTFSQQARHLLRLPHAAVPRPRELLKRVAPDDRARLAGALRQLVRQDRNFSVEVRIACFDDAMRHFSVQGQMERRGTRQPRSVIGILQDISERKLADIEIEYLAFYDSLTDLPNRELCQQQLERAIAAAQRHGHKGALLYLDIDHFKRINDTLGHDVGDRLLREVAARLRASVRSEDTVVRGAAAEVEIARLGGDEFSVLLPQIRRNSDAARVAQRIHAGLGRPIQLDGYEVCVTAAIGIAVFPEDGDSALVLQRHADIAMDTAKRDAGTGWRFYSGDMNRRTVERLRLEAELRRALAEGQFELHYQPQVSLEAGAVQGFEALVRWRHPQRGLVAPGHFIPVVEETGMIVALGDWVIDEGCRQLGLWCNAGHDISLSVNVSAVQFAQTDFIERLEHALQRHGVAADRFELELTETVLMENVAQHIEMLRRVRQSGVRVAVDDFGTGYSSLSYLKRLPLDKLKLDRSFVKNLPANEDDAAITQAVLVLAGRFGLRVVAEGVETRAQHDFLRRHGCAVGQGFLYGRPVPADQAERQFLSSAPAHWHA